MITRLQKLGRVEAKFKEVIERGGTVEGRKGIFGFLKATRLLTSL